VTIIGGMLSLLAKKLSPEPVEVFRSFVSVRRGVERLTRLVSRVIEIATAGEYQKRLTKKLTDLNPLLLQVRSDVETFLAQRNLKLGIAVESDLPPIPMDEDKIYDVLLNLVMNAIKFTPDGQSILIAAGRVDSRRIEVHVTDTGVGVPEGDQPHLFEEFFAGLDPMVHSSGEFEFGKRGIGLGLAIVKKFVEMHDGTVGVRSSPGTGSSFFFTLPVEDGVEAPCEAEEISQSST